MDKLELPASLTRRPAPARKRKKDAVAASTRKSVGVLVLGMHRSGTSALTRVLNLLGAALPKNLLGANYSNPEGHWESLRGIEINDGLLNALGRTWDDVRELPAGWMQRPETALAREQIRALLDLEFSREKLWVLKDPRLCRLAPIWLEAMDDAGIDARIVVPVRQPAEVAYSLARRDGMATGQSYFLWLQHLIDAERSTRSRPRSLVHFHQLMSDWRGVTDRIARQLGISWPNKSRQAVLAVDEFLRPDSVHADAKADDELATRLALPSPLAKLYAELMEAEPAQAWEAIAGVANSLSRSAPVFVPAIDALTRRLQRVQARADDVNAALAAGMADVPRWTRTAEQLEQLQEAKPLLHELIAQVEAQRSEYGPRLHEQVQYLAMLQTDYQALLAKVDATPALLHELVAQVEAQRGELAPRQAEIVQGLSQLQAQSIGLVERIDAAAGRAGEATPLLNELVAQVEAQRGELAPRQAELVQGLAQLQAQSIGLVERIDAAAARAGEHTPLLNEMVAQIEAQRRELGPRLVEQIEAIAAVQRQFVPLFERVDVAPPLLHELIAQVEAQRNEYGPRLAVQLDALGNVQAQLQALLEKAQASPPLLHELIAQVEAQRAEYGPRLAEQVQALGQLQQQLQHLIGTADAPPLQAQLQALAEKADASPPLLHELIAQIEAQRREFGPPIQDAPQQLAELRAENRQGFETLAQSTPLLNELIAQVEAQRSEYGPRLHEQVQALSQLQLQLQQLVGTADAAPLQALIGDLAGKADATAPLLHELIAQVEAQRQEANPRLQQALQALAQVQADYVRLLERAEQAPPLLHELIAQVEAQRNELGPRLDAQAGVLAELRAENRQGFDALAQSTPLLNELIAQVEAQRNEYGPRLTEQQAWLAQLHAGNERNFEKLDRAEPLIAELIRQIEAQREEFAPALQRQLQQIDALHQSLGERDQQIVRLHRIVAERHAELAASGRTLAGREARIAELDQAFAAKHQHAASLEQQFEALQQQAAAREVVLEEWHQHAEGLQKVLAEREATLAELRQRAEDQQQVLAAREVVLEEWHQHAENLQKVVGDHEATLAGLREHAEGLERQATEREAALAEWSKHAEGLQQVLAERDAALAELHQHAEGLQQVLAERDAALAELHQHAEGLQQVLAERDAALADSRGHGEGLQGLLDERDATLAEWSKHAGNLELALAERDAALAGLREHADQLQRQNEERDEAIAGQQQQLNDRHAAIAGLHQALEALEQQMLERDALLAEWGKHAGNLEQEVAWRNAVLASLEATVAHFGGEVVAGQDPVAAVLQLVAGRDQALADLGARLAEQEHARANVEQVLASREGYIEALRQTVTDGSTHIGQLTEMVADREGNVADLSQRLAQRDAHVAQLTDVVAHREASLAELSRRLAQRDAHIAQLVQVVRDHEGVVHELLSSSSWRLTRPLRAMKNLLSGKSPSTEVHDTGAFDAQEFATLDSRVDDGGLPAHAPELRSEGRASLPAPIAPQAPAARADTADFDRDFYVSQYPDIIQAGLDPYAHFLSHGRAEGRLGKLPVFDIEPGGKGFDPSRETVLVVSHEASRTGAPVLSLNIVEMLQRRYNVVSLLMGPGLMVEAFRQESALLVGPLKLHGDTPKAKLLISQLHRTYPLKYAIANSIESRVVLEALTKLGVPSVALVHEFAAYTRPRHAFHEAIFWASETVFSTPITHDNAVSEIPELREQPANILPQGRSLLVTEERSEAAKAKEDARVLNTLRPDGPLDDRVVVIGAGFVQQRKGVDLFIEVAARVLATDAGKRCRFVWIGKGYDPENDMGYSVYLADQLRRSGIERQVVMMDETSSIEVAYDNADILLISSRLDPLPNVAIDAMSHGLPVICFERTTGFADILAESGVREQCVAPYLDTADMAAKVVALASSREQRQHLGQRMQQIVAERFDMGRYVDSLDALAAQAGQRIAADEVLAREIIATGLMRRDFFPRAFEREAPAEDLVRFLYLRGWESGIGRRKLFPGFHPGIWQERHGLTQPGLDPLVDWLRAGRPPGPWTYEVIADSDPAAPSPPDDARIALHLHVYYADLLPEMLTRLDGNAVRPDLFISVPNARVADEIREALAGYTGRVIDVQVVPNRGRDIGPFLTAFGPALLADYDLVGHLHTKKTADLADASVGKLWYAFLLENLLGGKAAMADRILGRMAADPSIGMVFPDDPNIVGWGSNQPFIAEIAERVGVREFPVHFHFPVGTMFWARVEALRPLLELGLPWESYPTEPLPYDGSVLHALERLFPLVAEQRGTRVALTNVSGVSR